MKKLLSALCLAGTMLLTGCATSVNNPIKGNIEDLARPDGNESTVIFYRPSILGVAVKSVIASVNEDKQIEKAGAPGPTQATIFKTKPGKYQFVIGGEAQNKMYADLLADHVYVASIEPRIGYVIATFSLEPETITPKVVKTLKGITLVELKPEYADKVYRNMGKKVENALNNNTRRDPTNLKATDGLPYGDFVKLFKTEQ